MKLQTVVAHPSLRAAGVAALAALVWTVAACSPERTAGVRSTKLKLSSECYAQLRAEGDTEGPQARPQRGGLTVARNSANSCQELGAVVVVADADDARAKAWMCHNFTWCNGEPTQTDKGWRFAVPDGLTYGGPGDPVQTADGDSLFAVTPEEQAKAWDRVAHDSLLTWGLGSILTFQELEFVKDKSLEQDALYTSDNRRHYLRSLGQSVQNAKDKSNGWEEAMLGHARDAAQANDRTAALSFLAMALHQIMDSYSPAHADENGNPRAYPGPGHTFFLAGGESFQKLKESGAGPFIASQIQTAYYSVFQTP